MKRYKNEQNVIIKDLTYYILKMGKPLSEATSIGKILKQNGIRNMREFVTSDEEKIFQFKGIGKNRAQTIVLVIKEARKDYRKTLWDRVMKARFNADASWERVLKAQTDTDTSGLHTLDTPE